MSYIIDTLDNLLKNRHSEIEDWLHEKRTSRPPFIYSSVDLRHSGAKLAPVDTNLFPAGFNNLSPAACNRAVTMFRDRFDAMPVRPQRILIVPENHTRNLAYLENLAILADLVAKAGTEVRIGNVSIEETLTLTSMNGKTVVESPVTRKDNRLSTTDGFTPDLILLNNDCTAGAPEILHGLHQPIDPDYSMGWYARRKSEHFRAYEELVQEFSRKFNIDPWLISAPFHRCGVVNFQERKGIECVALGVEKILHVTRRKYEEYGITEKPYVFIKADSGTYGMGIMTVESSDQLLELNKKTRNKMNIIKEGTQNTEVIIQEGIPTIDRVEGSPAEAMIYLVDGVPVGGAYRVNTERDDHSNLNASGMKFVGMCDESECGEKEKVKIPNCNFCVFGLVSALAALAAPHETYNSLDIGFVI
ncbi:MAG TPA: glutamate--cysteine ligase [Rickettsiales bacterium]|nr:glutamate--cysteine ligase [Rickettsiales bacterium]